MNASRYDITPKQIFPPADCLVIQAGQGIPPSVNWFLGKITPGRDAVPDVGTPGHSDYVKGSPAIPDQITQHSSGTIVLTQKEWDGWTTQKDEDYLRDVVTARLSVTVK